MPLDVGKHDSLIPTPANQTVHVVKNRLFKLAYRAVALVFEAIEIDQRCNVVIPLPEQTSYLVGHASYGDSAAKRHWPRFDSLGPQVIDEKPIDELFFSWSFDGDRQTDQGRPPRRFFCQS